MLRWPLSGPPDSHLRPWERTAIYSSLNRPSNRARPGECALPAHDLSTARPLPSPPPLAAVTIDAGNAGLGRAGPLVPRTPARALAAAGGLDRQRPCRPDRPCPLSTPGSVPVCPAGAGGRPGLAAPDSLPPPRLGRRGCPDAGSRAGGQSADPAPGEKLPMAQSRRLRHPLGDAPL